MLKRKEIKDIIKKDSGIFILNIKTEQEQINIINKIDKKLKNEMACLFLNIENSLINNTNRKKIYINSFFKPNFNLKNDYEDILRIGAKNIFLKLENIDNEIENILNHFSKTGHKVVVFLENKNKSNLKMYENKINEESEKIDLDGMIESCVNYRNKNGRSEK